MVGNAGPGGQTGHVEAVSGFRHCMNLGEEDGVWFARATITRTGVLADWKDVPATGIF